MKALHLFLICFPIIIFFSCEKNGNDLINYDELIGTWQLDSVFHKSDNMVKQYPDTLYKHLLEKHLRIEFIDSSEVKLYGYCNRGSATYILSNDNRISFVEVGLSQGGCYTPSIIWESYLFVLCKVTSYKIEETKLYFYSESDIDLYLSKVIN